MKDRIHIDYMHNHAFFTCDCGKKVIAVNWWGLYKGKCDDCGLKWEIKNGMIRSIE